MSKRTLIRNVHLFDPANGHDGPGGVVLYGDRIVAVFGGDSAIAADADVVIDGQGATLLSGLIDSRVHLSEPGLEYRETVGETARLAARGGISTVIAQPSTAPAIDRPQAVYAVSHRSQGGKGARMETLGALTVGCEGRELAELGLLAEAGALGFSNGTAPVGPLDTISRALNYARSTGLTVCLGQMDAVWGEPGVISGELAARMGLGGIPALAEVMSIERDLRLVEMTGVRAHFDMVTSAEGVNAIRDAKARGLSVTAGTGIAYATLTDIAIGDYRTHAKLHPPLRPDRDRLAVVQGLADGTLDTLASDHRPIDTDHKRVPFEQAEPGMVGLETFFSLALSLEDRGVSKARLISALTSAPASVFALESGIRPNAPADLALVDLDRPRRLAEARLHSRCRNFNYEGIPARGVVLKTYVGGKLVFERA
ncbi:amidohydrolase family protein [Alphaproteobacteria bacterium]|nr:amidohydrolase family protein [Alphaproteobacteria bacterium]